MKELCSPCDEKKQTVIVDSLPSTLCPEPEVVEFTPQILPETKIVSVVTDTLLDTLEKVHRTHNCPHDVVNTETYKPPLVHGKPPRGEFDKPYAFSFTVTLGKPPYVFSLIDGVLPFGLSFSPSTGEIHGTPGEVGRFNFTIRVVDEAGKSNSLFSSLDIVV